ncbi:MAG: bifunctional N-acetylglucosamine-1-phosphate uridyltransferase/glucosamine-1-phosphate acetyltransferase [Planctomycetes bacterium]|nr:bifunctional N-acetylglucosamine-1-phosphate uridyltransferase/glucosamine-1-phosphate acetyltransferase [Planctomycetota bacterium]
MKPIVIPQEDVNSEAARIVSLRAARGDAVKAGDAILTVETSKAVFDVPAPGSGLFLPLFEAGAVVPFNVPVAYVAESPAELEALARQARPAAAEGGGGGAGQARVTRKARQLALQYGVPLEELKVSGIIKEKDVQDFLLASGRLAPGEDQVLTDAGQVPRGLERVLLVGAGLGAMQVMDILLNAPHQAIAGLVDDDESLRGTWVLGFPVLGTSRDLPRLWREAKAFDAAVVTISTSVPVRRALFERCRELGIPMANAVDPTVRRNRLSRLGQGNVICSFVHIGTCAVLGDNNFISAHSSIEHHNLWGSHITTGPGVMTSSRVRVGDGVKMGTGIFIQPGLSVGKGCQIASGAVLIRSVPDGHAVKTRITTELVKLEEQGTKQGAR